MAALPLRTRDQPDIRARISIHDDESPNELKELLIADQTQNKLRSQQSWHPLDTPNSLHRTILRKTRTLPYPYRLGHLQDLPISDPLPNPLNRSASFDSLSTLHRHAEAASLSRYRDSPISAISPPSAALACKPDIVYEPQDPCPPLRVETLSQQRKYQKLLKKSLKKKEQEQIKAQKEDEQLRRAFLAAEVAAERRKNAIARGEAIPLRDKSTKTIASEVIQKLSLNRRLSLKRPLSKLGRQVKKEKSNPPTLDDFGSKQQLQEWLNPPRNSDDIAELPAELPQYTPFQNSTRTQDNEPLSVAGDGPKPDPKTPEVTVKEESPVAASAKTSPRSMRCDSCQSPIRLSQVYYQCTICENGDRIVCSSCDQAGLSCRHEIVERVRSVSKAREADTTPSPANRANREGNRQNAQQYASAMWGLNLPDSVIEAARFTESPQATISAANPWAYNDILEARNSKHVAHSRTQAAVKQREDAEIRRRELEVASREKELIWRERETSFREQRASLRERETALEIKQQVFALQLQTALVKQMQEAATGVGAQFPDLESPDHIRSHANKRKAAGGQASISPSNSIGSNQKSSPKRSPSGGLNEDEDDEAGAGTPKKVKQDPDALASPEKLYACPYCKFDKSRYSELNMQEKQYRGCSSGYWPDISRLKQHLYRVHCRRLHCLRCWNKFDTKEQLEHHMREVNGCSLAECPCPEKFDEVQYNDIRRKRPASSPEQVWYTIFGILFPGQPHPPSPYADNVKAQSPSVASPGAPPQDAMDVLGEVFELRLNQHGDAPEQAWLRLPGAREFIREQLRASMTDVLLRLGNANSPSIGNPSLDISPFSVRAPGSTRRSSISLTPNSSIPPSPVNGPGSQHRSGSDSQFLLPAHRQSFSRPFPSRSMQNHVAVAPVLTSPEPPAQRDFARSGVVFPTPIVTDVENDRYDDECNSWSHGDEQGLAISDFTFDFNPSLSIVTEGFNQMPPNVVDVSENHFNFQGVQPNSITSNTQPQAPKPVTQLKPKHSTTSSVDSGYGSFSHRSSSASSRPVSASNSRSRPATQRPAKDKLKSKAPPTPNPPPPPPQQPIREPSPVHESAINFDALDVPFHEFLGGGNWDMEVDEFGNVGGESLSAYLNSKYPVSDALQDDLWGNQVSGV